MDRKYLHYVRFSTISLQHSAAPSQTPSVYFVTKFATHTKQHGT